MERLWVFLLGGVMSSFIGCNSEIPKKQHLHITEEFIIDEGDSLVLGPGSEMLIDSGVNIIARGDVFIKGTKESPVYIGGTGKAGWGILSAKGSCRNLVIHHAIIENGRITSYQSNNHFKNVQFKNNQPLVWNDALARFWYGEVLIENCISEGINKGEGFLLHNVQHPNIRNCRFKNVPDAIEYIACKNGQIVGNYFEQSNDDAIDQNACFNILIKDNQIYDAEDCGMELGSEKFGSSDSLKVFNNLIIGCKKGIYVKESSFVMVENATFFNNKTGIEVHTPEDSSRISRVTIKNSVFAESKESVSSNQRSEVMVSDCISDGFLPDGNGNKTKVVKFKSVDSNNYEIIEPTFLSQKTGFRFERKD